MYILLTKTVNSDVVFKCSGKRCVHLQGYSSPDSDLKKELHRKDALIARLIAESNIYIDRLVLSYFFCAIYFYQ